MKSTMMTFAVACLVMMSNGCAPVDLAGDWSGTWHTTFALDSGDITMHLEQDGDAVTGSFDLTGTVCVGTGSLHGTIDNRQFDATLSNGVGGEISIDTRVSADSDRFDGDFTVTGGFCQNSSGKLELKRD